MSDITVVQKTQVITVDAATSSVAVISAGPVGPAGPAGSGGVVDSIVAGTNVTVDDTDPANPIVSATGGGGGGPHASTHADGGADEISIDASQMTSGTLADARIPSGIARDSEVTSAITTERTAAATLTNKTLTAPVVNLAINAQTGTSYTFVLTDAGKLVTGDNASAITFTVPPNSSVAFPVGTQISVAGMGVGLITIAEGSGVNVDSTPSLGLRARFSGATLIKLATNAWIMFGDLA